MTRPSRRAGRRAVLPVVALALAFGLSACGATAADTAGALHASVVQVAGRAAAGDYPGAIAELALLDRDVTAALAAGSIDAQRANEIRAAMQLVRADLEAAYLAAGPSPTPAAIDGSTVQGGADTGSTGTGSTDVHGNGKDKGNGQDNGKGNG